MPKTIATLPLCMYSLGESDDEALVVTSGGSGGAAFVGAATVPVDIVDTALEPSQSEGSGGLHCSYGDITRDREGSAAGTALIFTDAVVEFFRVDFSRRFGLTMAPLEAEC